MMNGAPQLDTTQGTASRRAGPGGGDQVNQRSMRMPGTRDRLTALKPRAAFGGGGDISVPRARTA